MRKLFWLTILCCCAVISAFGQSEEENFQLAREYYESGQADKAVSLYDKLAKNPAFTFRIHDNYVEGMMRLEQYDKAEKYLKKQIKAYPTNGMFHVEYGILLTRMNRKADAHKFYTDFINEIKSDDNVVRNAARYFLNDGLYDYAETLYLEGRKNGTYDYHHELANLYALSGKNDRMLDEYLALLEKDPNQLDYVQNVLQSRISAEEDWERLEPVFIGRVQKNPEKSIYGEMLIWFYLQKQEFYKAFIQAKSIDKRTNSGGLKIFEIGSLALGNKDYKNAVKIFEYLNEKYQDHPNYYHYRHLLIKAREELVKNTFPVDLAQIKSLVTAYNEIISEFGIKANTAESLRNLALLQAFYLNQKDSAVYNLERIVNSPAVNKKFVNQAKIDLADIRLLMGEWWEATLVYSQVELAEKDRDLGHLAKLKNAKLQYYIGEFGLAKEHLDVLKLATSREIANDAMDLSLLIQDNMGLDTSETAMREFARIDLLVFQKQYDEALRAYDKMDKDFKDHALADEILWSRAEILLRLGRFEQAVASLEKIVKEFNEDIYGDDANFMMGKIYEENIKDKQKAMECYQNHLLKYPGSVFGAEARKRFRALRGDTQ